MHINEMMKNGMTIFTLVLLSTAGWAMTSDAEAQWQRARQLYYQGLQSKAALEEAIELFSQLAKLSEKTGVVKTYLGSLTALQAQYTPWPHKKLKYAKEGLKIMDDGLQKDPDDLEALFIHGTTSYFLPSFFNRRESANKSFKRILELLPQRFTEQDHDMLLNTLNFILEKADINDQDRHAAEQMKRQLDM
jgi:tetratricopeptide (TPR) repeat protein